MRFARCCWPAVPARGCAARSRSSRNRRRTEPGRKRSPAAGGLAPWAPIHMRIDVLTLFPPMFAGPLDESIIKRARETGRLDLRIHNLRDYAHDRHKTVDDRPFGGGPGMLLKPEPIFEAVADLGCEPTRVILFSPAGRTFNQ